MHGYATVYRGKSLCIEQEGPDKHMNDGEQCTGRPSSASISCYGAIPKWPWSN